MSWKEKKIDELTQVVTKGTTPSTYGYDFIDNGVNYIRAEGISKDGYVDESTFLKVSDDCHNKLFRSQLKENDILFSIAGMALGKTGIVKEEYLPANTNQAVGIIRPIKEIVFPKFLQFYFINPLFYKMVNSVSAQSAQPNINLAQIKSLKINLPPLETQKRIASILSNYDDLIENNLKRIKLLEETAQNIYKEWFVNFRFPNYEHTEFDAESGLPEGWETRKVTDFFDFIKGIEVGSANYENKPNSETLPFLRVGDISKRDGGIYVKKSLVKDKIVDKNDILISFDGSIGSVGYGLEGSYSSGLRKITSKTEIFGKGFMYCLVKSDNIQNTINSHAKGTTILHAGTSIIHLEFPLATDNVILSFNQISNPIFEQMVSLNNQNQKLKEARDILLPRLMNRTIEV